MSFDLKVRMKNIKKDHVPIADGETLTIEWKISLQGKCRIFFIHEITELSYGEEAEAYIDAEDFQRYKELLWVGKLLLVTNDKFAVAEVEVLEFRGSFNGRNTEESTR